MFGIHESAVRPSAVGMRKTLGSDNSRLDFFPAARISSVPSPSVWLNSREKRLLDFAGALILIAAALPLMAFTALAIKLSSPGPVLFRHRRCGRNGVEFNLIKFRTMYHASRLAGGALTCRQDPRVTPIGRFLRRWKLDELPQLFNVIRGDMSLVGPRPDVAEFLDELPPDLKWVLAAKPGITSAATLLFHNEEEILGHVPESKVTSYYVQTVLPAKVRIELEYARRATFFTDVRLLGNTLTTVLLRTR